MQVLNGAVFAKELVQVFFAGFFVHVGYEDYPAFDGADGDGAGGGEEVGGGRFGCGGGGGGRGGVDVHFCGGHGGVWTVGGLRSWLGSRAVGFEVVGLGCCGVVVGCKGRCSFKR